MSKTCDNADHCFFLAVWTLIKALLTAEQQKRVIFVKKSSIQNYIDADNLQTHMGGNVSKYLDVVWKTI